MPSRVLVVDDEEAARYGITRALTNQGYELEAAAEGSEALEKIERFRPDVVVSDINMPGMDGLTLLRKLNEAPEPPLVVLLTAYGSEAVAMEALRAGAYDYLPKPFEVDELRAIVRNAAERQQLLQENRRKDAELRQSYADLVQAKNMAALTGLVAGVAHEINSPLGALQANLQTVRTAAEKLRACCQQQPGGQAGADVALAAMYTAAGQCRQACERVSAIVKNLSRFAELDRADFRRAQLHEGLESAIELLRYRLEEGIELVRDFGDLPDIECRPRDLNQVFLNLLQNAIEALERDGGLRQIHLQTKAEANSARVAVTDTGCGIPAENLERIFDPGFTTKGQRVGLGLGLPICARIIRDHRGRIEVASTPGQGSTFTVILPLRAGE
jgi:signal transduction histidine kinase